MHKTSVPAPSTALPQPLTPSSTSPLPILHILAHPRAHRQLRLSPEELLLAAGPVPGMNSERDSAGRDQAEQHQPRASLPGLQLSPAQAVPQRQGRVVHLKDGFLNGLLHPLLLRAAAGRRG